MKMIATAALAALLTGPVYAHEDTAMDTDNELFKRCSGGDDVTVCSIKREHMNCEPAGDYDNQWSRFVELKGLPDPVQGGQAVDPELGPIGYIAIRMSEHYGHTYIYIVLEDVVCLGAIAHFEIGDPA